MNQELKIKWIEALRSGKYEQGQGFLKQEKEPGKFTYCCLGVLCEVAGLRDEKGLDDYYWFYSGGDQLDKSKSWLPTYFMQEIDWPEKVNNESVSGFLVKMNDGTDDFKNNSKCFNEIADWIEKNL